LKIGKKFTITIIITIT